MMSVRLQPRRLVVRHCRTVDCVGHVALEASYVGIPE